MTFFSDLQAALDALRAAVGDDVEAIDIPAAAQRFADDEVLALIEHASVLVRGGECVRIAGTGVVASRSARDAGHGGMAQKRGHRSTVSLIQDLTGSTRADAAKQVRLGEALAAAVASVPADLGDLDDAESAADSGTDAVAPGGAPHAVTARPWHAVLGDALMTGSLTSAQHDAIYRGLGEPRVDEAPTDDAPAAVTLGDAAIDDRKAALWNGEANAALETAAAQLIDEAANRTVEELAGAARSIRDLLDPTGAQRRFEQRFEARSFRRWTDRDGIRHGSFTFEDEGGAWIEDKQAKVDRWNEETRTRWHKLHPHAPDGTGPYPYRTEVTVRRLGAPVPQTLVVTFADGSRETVQWDADEHWHKFVWTKTARAVSAELDPQRLHYLDVSKLDDSRALEPDARASRRWSLEFAAVADYLLSLIATL